MRRYLSVAVAGLLLLAVVSGAEAQEKGQIGLAMGYPASVGILWHATDRIGVKATIGFAHSSNESTYLSELPVDYLALGLPALGIVSPTYTTSTSSTTVALALSGLFYLSTSDGVSTYVSPRVTINHASYHSEVAGLPIVFGGDDRQDSTTSGAFAGLFGVQYAPNRRFSVFAEAGLEYQSSEGRSSAVDSTNRSVGTRSGVGVVLYLGR